MHPGFPARFAAIVAFVAWLVLLGTLAFSIHDHPLYDPDEGRYARVTQETMAAGEMVVPQFEGKPRLQKPPLIHWLQGAAFVVLGESHGAARLPSLIFTMLTAVLLLQVTRRLRDMTTALIASILFLAMPLVFVVGRLCIIDPVLNFWWTAAIFTGFLAVHRAHGQSEHDHQRGHGVYVWAFFLSVAMGLLTKGPIALIPLGVVIVWMIASGRARSIAAWQWTVGAAVMITPLMLWVATVIVQVGFDDAVALWKRETLDRITGSGDHREPLWYYLPVVLVGFFPATALLPVPGVHYTWREAMAGLRQGNLQGYLAISVLIPLVILSLIGGKLATYVLPLGAPIALAAAIGLRAWLSVPDDHRVIKADKQHPARRLPDGLGSIAVLFTVPVIVMLVLLHVESVTRRMHLQPDYLPMMRQFLWGLLAIAPVMWVAQTMWRKATLRMWALLLAAGCVTAVYVWTEEMGEDRLTKRGSRQVMIETVRETLAGERVFFVCFGMREPSLSFYARQQVQRLDVTPEPVIHPPAGAVMVAIVEGREREKFEQSAWSAGAMKLLEWPEARDRLLVYRLAEKLGTGAGAVSR